MNKSLLSIVVLSVGFCATSQGIEKKKSESLLKELSVKACNCIDSIDTRNKSSQDIAKEVHKCIDAQTGAYQMGAKLLDIDLLSSQKTFNIEINTNKNSQDYKKYYDELERFLLENCDALKSKMASNDLENEKSVSRNPKALKEYSKGLKYYKAEEYEKALPYFRKAVEIDSVFAFAWDNIGICNRRMNNYDAAIYAYNRSLALDPNGITALQNIAVAYEYKKEYQKAIAAYQTLSELDSFNPEVFYGIGRVYAVYLNDQEKGLDNMCKAFNLYVKMKSPYRIDAENVIKSIYAEMKKQDKIDRFNEIMKANDINVDSTPKQP